MKIVADSNILSVESRFEDIADLKLISGRSIRRKDLLDADALLVRSITRVDKDLLDGTKVRFVGSATSGTDHIDLEYLQSKGIQFAEAGGSNANAVVDYCFAALAFAILHRNLKLQKCRVGIVGAGHVGGLFANRLQALGVACKISDPPLEQFLKSQEPASNADSASGYPSLSSFCALEELLNYEIVSLHVPLVFGGKHPTYRLLGEREFAQLQQTATLINTCRGSVVLESALIKKLKEFDAITYIADVWENEPDIFAELTRFADIATPHIAGYSHDAKMAATQMMLAAVTAYFELPAAKQSESELLEPFDLEFDKKPNAQWQYLLDIFPLVKLSEEFKNSVRMGNANMQFDAMRKRLLGRREFRNYAISGAGLPDSQLEFLQINGIKII